LQYDWEAYRDVVRLGRKTRLPEAQRKVLWSIFKRVRAGLKARQLMTHAQMFSALATSISKNKNMVFDFAVVDEAQDISVAHVRFFAAWDPFGQTLSFLRGTWGSASSNSLSHGSPWLLYQPSQDGGRCNWITCARGAATAQSL
jgi:hypothetical protein